MGDMGTYVFCQTGSTNGCFLGLPRSHGIVFEALLIVSMVYRFMCIVDAGTLLDLNLARFLRVYLRRCKDTMLKRFMQTMTAVKCSHNVPLRAYSVAWVYSFGLPACQ